MENEIGQQRLKSRGADGRQGDIVMVEAKLTQKPNAQSGAHGCLLALTLVDHLLPLKPYYFELLVIGGIDKLKEIHFYRPESKLVALREEYFQFNPPAAMQGGPE